MSKEIEMKWNALAERIGPKHGDDIVEAMKELYGVFDSGIVEWMASLYDPEHGAWYYSKSAQATDGYLPNAESTLGATGYLVEMGATDGRPVDEVLPEWLKKKIGAFIYNLQDHDGYFYHPQWGKDISHLKKSRDLGTCKRLLRTMGNIEPKYPIPTDLKKGDEYDISQAPERFRSVENYMKYLNGLDFVNRGYNCGSEMSSQVGEVESYGKMLGVDLMAITLDHISSFEREDTGLWHTEKTYYATNGMQKISKMYNWFNRKIPYVYKALDSTMEIIMKDDPVGASVDVYNPWHAVGSLVQNIKNVYKVSESEFADIIDKVYTWAPAAIRKSAEKMKVFKKPDGGMSYLVETSCPTDQRAPAAVSGSVEGDVNGTGCATAIIPSIYNGLDLNEYKVPLYTRADWEKFMSIVEAREAEWQKTRKV